MSHASNKVEWCLRKAEKEIGESVKHRGLLKNVPDLDEARKHIEKAEHNLRAIDYFNKGKFSDWSMSATFYSIYHCFLAIACRFGYESRNQECTIALIEYLREQNKIEIEQKFIDALKGSDEEERHETAIIEKREFYTYGTTSTVDNKDEIAKNIELCKDCIYQTRKIVFSEDK